MSPAVDPANQAAGRAEFETAPARARALDARLAEIDPDEPASKHALALPHELRGLTEHLP